MAININQLEGVNITGIPLVESSITTAFFNPSTDYIEYVIQSVTNNNITLVNYDFKNYSFPTNGTVTSNNISDIEFNPEQDLNRSGFTLGNYNTYYNFYKNQLQTSYINQNLFIKEISADRTELKLNFLSFPITLVNDLEIFKQTVSNDNSIYFEEFYLNFGNNNLVVANNFNYDPTTYDVIINLLDPLPSNITTNTQLWIVTKIADSIGFNIEITPDRVEPTIVLNNIKGPNFNLSLNDKINNSTDYIDSTQLFTTTLSSSYSQLSSILEEKGIEINIDYSDFSNFVHFSSAVQRINNFVYKVGLIEDYTVDLNTINSITGSTSQSISVSSSKALLENKINNLITNFDGFEYYMYYTSGSTYSYPKQNSTQPYTLYSSTSPQVLTWLGDSNINSSSFSGVLSSASLYDKDNKDYLYYTIPKYLTDDSVNNSYITFVQMVGQYFDNIWTYYKDVTNLYQADNRLDYGISKDLVSQALQSFGVKLYQNNFSTDDLYSAFLGYLSNPNITGSLPVTSYSGQEYITSLISASYSASIQPLDDIEKEVYKRLYHNLPYLAKTKGTIPGLRALINCFGIPDTVLRISEFGGRDKDTSTYDYFDQQFNYNLFCEEIVPVTSSFLLNSNWGAGGNRPESIQLRIQNNTPNVANFSTAFTQSIFEISGSDGGNYSTNLTLWYTGSGLATSSYSGSVVDPYYQYGTLILDIKGGILSPHTCSIYAPFFDGNWWSIMINRSGSFGGAPGAGAHVFTLFAGNAGYYDGYDGNQVMNIYSSSTPLTQTWGYSGSKISFFDTPTFPNYSGAIPFYGNAQEIRYWATTQSIDSFKDYIMNPQSIDYSGEITYANKLAARLPLGGDLYTGSISVHPKITGSWATTSSFASNSTFYISSNSFRTNVEPRFLNSPIVGLKGRVTDKIQIVSSSLPTGSVISQYISIEQNYPVSGSESPDVNMLEVAFSPQNEINDDIIDSLGYFNIGEYIGDPRQVSSSATSYPDLDYLSNNFFQKYFDTYDLKDYIRLIKYFDNSLFKMIKDFVPARTSLTSGVVIKQHILERNKYPQPQVYDRQYQNLNITSSGVGLSSSFNYGEDLTYTGSIETAFISGSTGGVFNPYNVTTFAQDWIQDYTSSIGVSYISHSSQDEFYNGELPGTEFTVVDGELNPDNEFKLPTTLEIYYDPTLYLSSITPLGDFLDINTSPNQGEIYLWYDTGSILQPGGPPIQR